MQLFRIKLFFFKCKFFFSYRYEEASKMDAHAGLALSVPQACITAIVSLQSLPCAAFLDVSYHGTVFLSLRIARSKVLASSR